MKNGPSYTQDAQQRNFNGLYKHKRNDALGVVFARPQFQTYE